MYTTIAIVIVVLVVAAAAVVGLKTWRGGSEPESGFNVPKRSGLPDDAKQVVERARAIQQQYWTLNPDEKKRLLMKGGHWRDVLKKFNNFEFC